MRKLWTLFPVGLASSGIALFLAGVSVEESILVSLLGAITGTMVVEFGFMAATRKHRHFLDVQYLQRGVCPCCKATGGLVEVTSSAERIVVCAPCTNAFALVLDRGQVAANRLGEKPGYLQ